MITSDVALRDELDAQRLHVAELEQTVDALAGSNDPDSAHARDIAERSLHAALEVITEIEHALDRIGTEAYGMCESCGGAIAPARLEAIPYTRHCVSCPQPPPLRRAG